MNKKLTTSLVASLLIATNLYSQEALEEIKVVSATKSQQSIKDVTSNISVITKEEIEERNYINLTEALNSVPGLSFTSNGGLGTVSSLRLNGMHYKTILILIDGIRYNDLSNDSAFPEHILMSNIEQIEIIKGAQSGIWGADASGGVINIITKTAKEGFHGNGQIEYGKYNTKKYAMGISYKKDKYYIKLDAQRLTTDGFSAKASRGENLNKFEDDSYKNTTISAKTGYKIDDNNKIDFNHTYIKAESEYDGSSADDSDDKSTSKNNFTKVNFNNTNIFSEIDIYASKSKFDRKDPTGYTKRFLSDIKEYGLKSNFKYGQRDFLILGLDRKDFNQKEAYSFDYQNNGFYLTNSNFFNDGSTILTESLRYDTYTKFKNKTTGKIGLKQYYKSFVFATNYGTGYNAPSLYELSHDGGNDLKPELNKSFDISAGYKGLEVKYFKNKIEDLLAYNNNGTSSNYTDDFYENVDGTSVIKGYEINYKKSILKDILISLSYTNVDAKDSNGKTLGRVAKETLKSSFDYYGFKNLHINLNGEYVGDRWDRNGEPVNGKKTGRYTLWNTVVNYKVNKKISTYLKVDNLFDKYYQTVDGYATSPRAAYVGIKAKF